MFASSRNAVPPDIPAAKFRADRTEDHRMTTGHVLAAVIADSFDDHRGSTVAHAATLADHAVGEDAPSVAP